MAAVARAALPRLARALAAPARSHARAMSSVVELSSYLEKYKAVSCKKPCQRARRPEINDGLKRSAKILAGHGRRRRVVAP